MSNPHTAHSTQSTSDKNYELRTTNYELTEPLTSHLATHHSPPRPVRSTCPDNCLTPVGASRGGLTTRHCSTGQALIELAIFGSLAIMVLGVLINYGLGFDFNQRNMMEAYRQAMALSDNSATTGGASYVRVKDHFLPDASDPFGVGSTRPVSASAFVLRDYRTHQTAETVEELPRVRMRINNETFQCPKTDNGFCTTAAFRTADHVGGIDCGDDGNNCFNDPGTGEIDRYEEIYGAANIEIKDTNTIEIIDPCHGEILNFEGCVRIARQIVDDVACVEECERGRWFDGDGFIPDSGLLSCDGICAQHIASADRPWYAKNPEPLGGHRYNFPHLNAVFAGFRSFGIQPGVKQTTEVTNTLKTQNTPDHAKTKTTLDWDVWVDRKVKRHKYGHPEAVHADNTKTNTLHHHPKNEKHTTTWTTNWD